MSKVNVDINLLNIEEDTLVGVAAIAAYLGKSPRQVFYLCERAQIPSFKIGRKWHLRKSKYRSLVESLEAQCL